MASRRRIHIAEFLNLHVVDQISAGMMQENREADALCFCGRQDEVREGVPLLDVLVSTDAAPVIARHGFALVIAEDDSSARGDGRLAACFGISVVGGDGELGRRGIVPVPVRDAIARARFDLNGKGDRTLDSTSS